MAAGRHQYMKQIIEIEKYKRSCKVNLPEYFIALTSEFTTYVSSNTFIPIKITKFSDTIILTALLPNLFKKITIDYCIVAQRKDVEFKLEE